MTCIVGLATKDAMVMGGDSAGVAGYELRVRSDPKVFMIKQKNGPNAILGFTSSFRMGQILMSLELPEDKSAADDRDAHVKFLVNKAVPLIRTLLKDQGCAEVVNNQEVGGQFLLAYRGWIYDIEADFQVAMPQSPFAAIGCGAAYAIGALTYLHNRPTLLSANPEEIVRRVLCVSEQNSAGVRGPMKVIVLPNAK